MGITDEFKILLASKLAEFHYWSQGRSFLSCRLVTYCGAEYMGAIEVALDEIESQIEWALSTGYGIDWAQHEEQLVLCVGESLPDALAWQHVFAEEDMVELLYPMRNLAAAVLDYLWFLEFSEGGATQSQSALKMQENLSRDIRENWTEEEKRALSVAAACRLGWLQSPGANRPDTENLSHDQTVFLEALAYVRSNGSFSLEAKAD